MFPRRYRRTFEALESRSMLAAYVSVEQIGDDLFISGGDSPLELAHLVSNITILGQNDPGEFTVSVIVFDPMALDSPPLTPTIYHFDDIFGDIVVKLGNTHDNVRIQNAHVLGDVTIDLGDGDDYARLGEYTQTMMTLSIPGSTYVTELPLEVEGNLRVAGGSGSDDIDFVAAIVHGNARIETGSGDDRVLFVDADEPKVVDGTLSISLGEGDDLALLGKLTAGASVMIQDSSGDATVHVAGSIAGSLLIKTAGGDDQVTVTADVDRNVLVYTGSGDDRVTQRTGDIGGSEVIVTGSGDDQVLLGFDPALFDPLDNSEIVLVNAPTPFGDPTFEPIGQMKVHIAGNLSVDLGTGADTATLAGIDLDGTLQVRGRGGEKGIGVLSSYEMAAIQISLAGNSTDHVTLDSVTARRISVETQGGNDILELSYGVVDSLFVSLGEGDDELRLSYIYPTTQPSKIDGGNGNDHVLRFSDLPANLELLGFESIAPLIP